MSDLKKLKKRDDELAHQIDELDVKISGLRADQRRLAKEHNQVRTDLKMERRLSKMNDAERAALAQALKARGIVSEEKAGIPGA